MHAISNTISRVLGGDEQRPYRCRACGGRFRVQHHVCPDCGSFTVDRADWSDG